MKQYLKETIAVIVVIIALASCSKKETPALPEPTKPQYDFTGVDNLMEQNLQTAYSGNVVTVVTKDNSVVYSKSLGSFNENTSTQIASATKTFSAIVILSLVDQGLINLDDSVGKYLPIFTRYGKGKCTIRQCFSHTGGWPGNTNPYNYLDSDQLTLAQAVDSIAKNINYDYIPGTRFRYGGVSMHIIGRVAEVASGKPWNQLFKEIVADKCNLINTAYCLTPSNPRIAGGICSTPNDIIKFTKMLLNKGMYDGVRVISETSWNELWKDQTNKVPVLASPYPPNPVYNNPFNASTIYYGIGDWLDVYNPNTQQVDQISGAGAFGTIFWVDRVRNITGVVFTSSLYNRAYNSTFQIIDIFRNQLK